MYGVYTPYIFVSYGLTCAGCCILLAYAVTKRRAARAALADVKQRDSAA